MTDCMVHILVLRKYPNSSSPVADIVDTQSSKVTSSVPVEEKLLNVKLGELPSWMVM